ncbi:copper homeostasis CutC domain-containing protein [Suillus paluster]|uniref:copper homeostasis CutC domain-containing protein n=1 Tax=Suillus paluster TaxID=48578 RepID=UPI001B86C5C1|nr:copper homeostasis CutC domain-containing protein [Suillus paluster]KAG1754923.1 copper homeostasis CutC domain-containing protein [Suillus paluster]
MSLILEVCVDSIESALAAVEAGADRLELCGNLGLGGGTTPSLGLLKAVRKVAPTIPIMIMIRPRTGDFVYTEAEFEVMIEDIRYFRENGVQGIVFGVLTPEGDVDITRTQRLVLEALPLQVCFHRAFDMTRDARNAWHQLSKIDGLTRNPDEASVTFRGIAVTSANSLDVLKDLLDLTNNQETRIEILPGSGINSSTVGPLCQALLPHGLREVHMSGGHWIDGASIWRRDGMGMGIGGVGEWGIWRTNASAVRAVKDVINSFSHSEA